MSRSSPIIIKFDRNEMSPVRSGAISLYGHLCTASAAFIPVLCGVLCVRSVGNGMILIWKYGHVGERRSKATWDFSLFVVTIWR